MTGIRASAACVTTARLRRIAARFLCDQQGFSLIELTLVLAILGVVIGGMLPLLGSWMERNTLQTTRSRMDAVDEALLLFLMRQQRLPCPALPGAEGQPGGAEALTQTVPQGAGGQARAVRCARTTGMIPYRALGLPQRLVLDGWSRPFSYAVMPELAQAAATSDFCTPGRQPPSPQSPSPQPPSPQSPRSATAKPSLDVRDETGLSVAPDLVIAYVVVSHGANGAGAFVPQARGLREAVPTAGPERLNSDGDLNFVDYPRSDQAAAPYDDSVRWQTRDALVLRATGAGCQKAGAPPPADDHDKGHADAQKTPEAQP